MLEEKEDAIVTNLSYLNVVSSNDRVQILKTNSYKILELEKGNKVLDVGCGLGDDVIALAEYVGENGKAVGVDVNDDAIKKARDKTKNDKHIEFHVNNAEILPFTDNYFDACRSERVFQHLKDPESVLKEMIRVTKVNGRINILDPDWGTVTINSAYQDITEKIINFLFHRATNGWMGRQLSGLFNRNQLQIAQIDHVAFFTTKKTEGIYILGIDEAIEDCLTQNILTLDEKERWLEDLNEKDLNGEFFASISGFTVLGIKNS